MFEPFVRAGYGIHVSSRADEHPTLTIWIGKSAKDAIDAPRNLGSKAPIVVANSVRTAIASNGQDRIGLVSHGLHTTGASLNIGPALTEETLAVLMNQKRIEGAQLKSLGSTLRLDVALANKGGNTVRADLQTIDRTKAKTRGPFQDDAAVRGLPACTSGQEGNNG